MTTNTERVLAFIRAVERGDDVAGFYAPDAVHEWLPNKLQPKGEKRDLQQLVASQQKGRELLVRQRYEVLSTTEQGDRVVVECAWEGVLKSGAAMKAFFAMVFELEGGLIKRARNYDCFT